MDGTNTLVHELFSVIDSNSSGSIDKREFLAAFESLSLSVTSSEQELLLKASEDLSASSP